MEKFKPMESDGQLNINFEEKKKAPILTEEEMDELYEGNDNSELFEKPDITVKKSEDEHPEEKPIFKEKKGIGMIPFDRFK